MAEHNTLRRALTLPLEEPAEMSKFASQRTCSQSQSPLFAKLPTEIRRMIWSYLLEQDVVFTRRLLPREFEPPREDWWACVRTCRIA
jgi:hypothetical protein